MPKDSDKPHAKTPCLRKPNVTDGAGIWELVRSCKPLDENSMYCNLVQADHFRDTCIVAELDNKILGWVSGHMIPNVDELFIWQVAVSPEVRGMGLGHKMLAHLITRDACNGAAYLKTTITKDNDASWALFHGFARGVGGALCHKPHFERNAHFDGLHNTEHLVTVSLPKSARLARAA